MSATEAFVRAASLAAAAAFLPRAHALFAQRDLP